MNANTIISENKAKQTSVVNLKRRPRAERRKELKALRRQKKKLERRLRNILLTIEFTHDHITAFGNFHLLETFKQSLDFKGLISELFTLNTGVNSMFSVEQTLDYLIDSTALGYSRFEHTEALRFDPGYRDVKGIDRFPSEKVFRDFFSLFDVQYLQQLCDINQRLIALRAHWESPKEVWFDLDSSTITLFGNQQGAEQRYNARYHGRPSYEIMVCFINETKELLYIEICPQGTTPKSQFQDFFAKCHALLPSNYMLKGVRIDKGFFSEPNLEYIEDQYLAYMAKVPLYANIRYFI